MTISLRLSEEDTVLIKKCAELKNTTVSEFIRNAVMEQIEDEYDLKVYERAMKEYQKNPVTYTLDEVEEELDLK